VQLECACGGAESVLDTDSGLAFQWPQAAPHPRIGATAPSGTGDHAANTRMSLVQRGRKEDGVRPFRLELETIRQFTCAHAQYPQGLFFPDGFQTGLDV
jgi:hypothetical protein